MIRVLMLDLGGTLIREDTLEVFPHVREALEQLNGMKTARGQPLAICLVSNFLPTPEQVEAIFRQYLDNLDEQLRPFFKPVERRVTLSTHTLVRKPDRRVFETALQRLQVEAALKECLFITEEADHIAACRGLGMQALQFGVDFRDWSEAPDLVAKLLGQPEQHLSGDLGPEVPRS
jgi:FMN phosphatase YigB (HAD superfamily)